MRWRRLVRTVLLYALLGAMATVLTSWAIHAAYFWRFDHRVVSAVPPRAGTHTGFSAAQWDAIAIPLREAGAERTLSEYTSGRRVHPGWMQTHDTASFGWNEGRDVFLHIEGLMLTDCGWPATSLRQWYYQRDQDEPQSIVAVQRTPALSVRGGVRAWPDPPVQDVWQTRFALPLLPLWPGFLLNTAFYALLLFAAWRVPGVIRRTLRRRRGRCAGCGYDRSGLDQDAACPECGVVGAMGTRRWAMGKRQRPASRA